MKPDYHSTSALRSLKKAASNLLSLDTAENISYSNVISAIHRLCASIDLSLECGVTREEVELITADCRKLHRRSTFIRRLQDWPKGIPGDFETINYLLRGVNHSNPGTLEWFLEDYGLRCNAANQHRYKMLWQAEAISKQCRQMPRSKILSVAAGSSLDVLIASNFVDLSKASIVVNDIDPDAVSCSIHDILANSLQVSGVVGNIFRKISRIKNMGPFNLIVAGGVLDYVSAEQSKWLIAHLLELLTHDGHLCLTNLATGNPFQPWMEFMVNWKLNYRGYDFLISLKEQCEPKGFDVFFRKDPTGLTWLIDIARHSDFARLNHGFGVFFGESFGSI